MKPNLRPPTPPENHLDHPTHVSRSRNNHDSPKVRVIQHFEIRPCHTWSKPLLVAMWLIIYATLSSLTDGPKLFSWIMGRALTCSIFIPDSLE